MAVARWLETDSNTNKDINAAVSIGVYTADADRMIVCDVSLDAVAGGGDYVVYITRRINGAGSAYVMLPKTTCAAASGETAIAMQSGPITVRSGDVLTVYVDGLAGDTTTPDTVVRWFEMATLRPATADRQVTVAATGEASANVTMWNSGALPQVAEKSDVSSLVSIQNDTAELASMTELVGESTYRFTTTAFRNIIGADSDTLKTLSDQLDAIDSDVWSYVSRTLTATPAQTTDGTAASAITRKRGDSWSISITLGAITGYTSVWLTIKRSTSDADSASLLQVRKNASGLTDGLIYVNGAAATNAALATITVNDATTGAITIAVDESVTDDLSPGVYDYDVQTLIGGAVSTPDSGAFTITADVTRSVA